MVDGTELELEFERREDGGVARWYAGCNTTGGPVIIRAETLEITPDGSSAVGCPDEYHAQDDWFTDFFDADPSWSLSGVELTLTAGDDVIELTERTTAP